jgi:hypothetical protein
MRYKVRFEIKIPDGISEDQAAEWIKYMIGYSGMLDKNHPLIDTSFDPLFGTFEMRKV